MVEHFVFYPFHPHFYIQGVFVASSPAQSEVPFGWPFQRFKTENKNYILVSIRLRNVKCDETSSATFQRQQSATSRSYCSGLTPSTRVRRVRPPADG